jgi:hypothetical protein
MRRWVLSTEKYGENLAIDAFLADIWGICEKHKLAISHEDGQGAFEVVKIADYFKDWLMNAHDLVQERNK